MNQTVTDKKGNTVSLCNYHWTDPDGHVELCHAPKACNVCGQCSRLDGESELGHCTGHLGLNEHIHGIPGTEQNKSRDEATKRQAQIREQQKIRARRKDKRNKK